MTQAIDWRRDYIARKGADRNDLLSNSGVLLQNTAGDIALIRALGRMGYRPTEDRVLDVGGGGGGSLTPFLQVGAYSELLTSVDVDPVAKEQGDRRFPGIQFHHLDASETGWEAKFDIVYSSGMFVTIPDDRLAAPVAAEMMRLAKPGGTLLLRDWVFPKFGDPQYSAVTRKRLTKLFPEMEVIFAEHGALIPPVGRFLSSYLPALYFLFRACFPVLTGTKVYVMRKRS
jgi:SAM-dependent methyltransferase